MASLHRAPRMAPHRTLATWTSHALNTGLFFNAAYQMIRALPAGVCQGMARIGTSVAHRLMRDTRGALADNFRGAFPDLDDRAVADLTWRTFQSYASDHADFFRSLERPATGRVRLQAPARARPPRHPRVAPFRQLGDGQRVHARDEPAADHRRDARGERAHQPAARRLPAPARRRHARGPAIDRHGAADPPPPLGESHRRDADGPARRA